MSETPHDPHLPQGTTPPQSREFYDWAADEGAFSDVSHAPGLVPEQPLIAPETVEPQPAALAAAREAVLDAIAEPTSGTQKDQSTEANSSSEAQDMDSAGQTLPESGDPTPDPENVRSESPDSGSSDESQLASEVPTQEQDIATRLKKIEADLAFLADTARLRRPLDEKERELVQRQQEAINRMKNDEKKDTRHPLLQRLEKALEGKNDSERGVLTVEAVTEYAHMVMDELKREGLVVPADLIPKRGLGGVVQQFYIEHKTIISNAGLPTPSWSRVSAGIAKVGRKTVTTYRTVTLLCAELKNPVNQNNNLDVTLKEAPSNAGLLVDYDGNPWCSIKSGARKIGADDYSTIRTVVGLTTQGNHMVAAEAYFDALDAMATRIEVYKNPSTERTRFSTRPIAATKF